MRRFVSILTFGLVAALAVAACGSDDGGNGGGGGGGGGGNTTACKNFVKTVQSCGGVYASQFNDTWCNGYSNLSCNIADYFSCVNSALGACTGGNFPNADSNALSACASKATCK